MKIFENDAETLSLMVVGTFETGVPPKVQTSELLMMFNARSKKQRYRIEPQLTIRADGEVIRTRQMKNYGSREEAGGLILEPLLTMTPYDVLAKMAAAKTVTIEIGTAKYELSSNSLEALRDVAKRMVQ